MSPLEPGPIYAPGAGPPHPAVLRRRAQAAADAAAAAAAALPTAAPGPATVAPPTAVSRPYVETIREHRRLDWALGILIGIVLGLAVAAGFVFLGSEDTVDAPRIHGIDTGKPAGPAAAPAETEKLPAE